MKKWLEPLSNAWEGVKTHKLRSSLTILGIVIGVAAVIALMSIGRGVQTQILSQIESMGSDVITVSRICYREGNCRSWRQRCHPYSGGCGGNIRAGSLCGFSSALFFSKPTVNCRQREYECFGYGGNPGVS